MEQTERAKMSAENLKIQEAALAEQIRKELRQEFPQITDKQVESIVAVRLRTALSLPIDVDKTLKTVDMGDDGDLSLNYKKQILSK